MKGYGCEVTMLTFAVSVLHFSAFIIIVIISNSNRMNSSAIREIIARAVLF